MQYNLPKIACLQLALHEAEAEDSRFLHWVPIGLLRGQPSRS